MAYGDIFNKTKTDGGYFGKFRLAGDRYYTLPVIDSLPGTHMNYDNHDCIMWSVNNYLGLAGNEELKQIASDTAKVWGTSGPMGSRMMSGNTSEHVKLEEALAKFSEKESSILFNFGYMGVQATIDTMVGAIVGSNDYIVVDKLDHASIMDAVFVATGLSADFKSRVRVFKHNNMENLEAVLKRINRDRKADQGVLIITEGVYGMTGDIAKLDEITALKEKYDARLFIDDAHGVGVMGPNGRGTAEHFGVQDKVDLYFGTFAKSFASIGGYTAASKDAVEWIRYNARTQVFAKSLPMVYVKVLQRTLEMVEQGHDRRKRLFEVSKKLGDGLRNLGFYVSKVDSPIVPVFTPSDSENPQEAMGWLKYMRDNGIFGTGVLYPVIPRGITMFRVIPTANHTDEDIDRTLEVFKKMRDTLGITQEVDEKVIKRIYGNK